MIAGWNKGRRLWILVADRLSPPDLQMTVPAILASLEGGAIR